MDWRSKIRGLIIIMLGGLFLNSTAHGWQQPALGEGKVGQPEILFTFDDGPHHERTTKILQLLAERNIQAVFFWVGHRIEGDGEQTQKRLAVARKALLLGHIIANHTVSHANLCQVTAEKAEWEIDENAKRYREALGIELSLFRAPYGADCQRLRRQLKKRGLKHMHWDMDPQEWKHHSLDQTVSYLKSKLRNLDSRAVILLHDTKDVSVDALRIILDWLDEENERRQKAGKPQIKILQPSQWMWTESSPLVGSWLFETGMGYGMQLKMSADSLQLP